MADTSSTGFGGLRRPEYTGENRCWPCTTVNTVIAILLSVGVAGLATTAVDTTMAATAGLAFFLPSATAIWLRGYLIPGTPELTKRHMPVWMLAWFGKAPEPAHAAPAGDVYDVDPEAFLSDAGAVEPCEDIDDLCLTEAFAERWDEELATVDAVDPDELRGIFGLEAGEYTVEEREEAVLLEREGHRIGEWPSRTALRVDVAGARALAAGNPEGWADLSPTARGRVLNGLRIFLDECPDGGEVQMEQETVESCCHAYDVVALTCAESGDRLLEQRVN
jgi:hypothetical protein